MIDELDKADGIALGALVREGQITPLELVERAVRRIEAVNPRLNAVIHRMYDEARRVAETLKIKRTKSTPGPFTGVPFLLKDLIAEYVGAPLWEGCVGVKGYVSKLDTELVRRQKSAGLVVVGKTNTPEFGGLPTTDCTLVRAYRKPVESGSDPGGIERGVCFGSGCSNRPHGPRKRCGGLDPGPGLLLRPFRAQAHEGTQPPGAALWRPHGRTHLRARRDRDRQGFSSPSGRNLRGRCGRPVLRSCQETSLPPRGGQRREGVEDRFPHIDPRGVASRNGYPP